LWFHTIRGWRFLVRLDREGHGVSAEYVLRNTSDQAISRIDFGDLEPGETSATKTVRIYNAGDAASSSLEIGALTIAGGITGDRNGQGQELITEQWLQARTGAGAFDAIGGDPLTAANVLSVTPPAAAAYIDIDFRLVIPAGASTRGGVLCFPFALYKP
jgi:hypothetical protein